MCPKCQSRATGKVSQNVYFCWDCAVEFVPTKDGFKVYRLEVDGTLVLDSLESKPVTSRALTLQGMFEGNAVTAGERTAAFGSLQGETQKPRV